MTRTRRRYQRTTVPMIRRMSALRGAGLSHAAVAAVVNLDVGTDIDGDAVRMRLRRWAPQIDTATQGRFHMTSPGRCFPLTGQAAVDAGRGELVRTAEGRP